MTNLNPIPASQNAKVNSFYFGAFLALVIASGYSLYGIAGVVISTATPYVAGVGMFVALLSVFGALITTMKKVRKSAGKQAMIGDCFMATAIIGVTGYLLAACVQTFQPGGNPAEYWTDGALAAATFAALFLGGKYGTSLMAAGQTQK
jgi:hypothetical protein